MLNSSKKHLKDEDESYFIHMFMALKISKDLFNASIKAFTHAFIPAFFIKVLLVK